MTEFKHERHSPFDVRVGDRIHYVANNACRPADVLYNPRVTFDEEEWKDTAVIILNWFKPGAIYQGFNSRFSPWTKDEAQLNDTPKEDTWHFMGCCGSI